MNERRDDLQEIIDKALEEMAAEAGDGFDPQACNLAEFCRRTGLTRSKARAIRKHGLGALPHGNSGRRAATTVPAGHTGLVDDLLGKGVTNSQVTCEKLVGQGYRGGLTSVKVYVAAHMDLVPAKRRAVAPQGSRGQRFRTGPGEAYQMDWGFVTVVGPGGTEHGIACFAMVCHHCSSPYVELFPNARQESLLIGMLHAYMAMGVPDEVPADSIKSVATGRDLDGRPVWQRDYSAFMGCVGFRTRLCRPRHPLAKGKVERLTRFARGNFLAGRDLTDIATLNGEALPWCAEQAGRWRCAVPCVPTEGHASASGRSLRECARTCHVCLRTSWFCRMRLCEVMERSLLPFRTVFCQDDVSRSAEEFRLWVRRSFGSGHAARPTTVGPYAPGCLCRPPLGLRLFRFHMPPEFEYVAIILLCGSK